MSVRLSLLAILDQRPCYGYQLRNEFDRRTASTWPLNVGQIYNTLERLERDGLVARGSADEQGHVYWRITDAGSVAVAEWLAAPVQRSAATRDELAIKVALTATLPGIDATAVIAVQRQEMVQKLAALKSLPTPIDLTAALIQDAHTFAAENEVRWLDHVAARIAAHPAEMRILPLDAERPKRGRPARDTSGVSPDVRPERMHDIRLLAGK